MRKHLGCVASALCAGLVLACTLTETSPALAAADCLAGPNGPSPKGQHWYYRIDRPTGRKCWYLGQLGQRARQAPPAAAARIKPAEPPRQTQAEISPESEAADPEIWPKVDTAAVRTAEAAPPVPFVMETRPPVETSRPAPPAPEPEPPPTVTANPPPQPAMPAQAATSSAAPLSLVLVVIGMAIIGFLARMLYQLATRRRLHMERGIDRDLVERPRFSRAIASPALAPEDTEPRLEDMLRRLPRRSERRVA